MAKDDELELDAKAPAGGGKKKLIIIGVIVMLITTGALVGILFFTGSLGSSSRASKGDDSEHGEEKEEMVLRHAFYINMKPAFIVNFEEKSSAAYLQIEMQAMTYDKRVTDHMTKHMPMIRNNVLLIMSAQKFERVMTRKGKEMLQEKILISVQEVIGESMTKYYKDEELELAKGELVPNVEQIYFTSFIMQ